MNGLPAITRITLVYLPRELSVWLRFGHSLYERRIDPMRRQLDFRSDALFARVHWEGNKYGTTCWQLQVLRAVRVGEIASPIAGVEPGAEILLDVRGNDKVRRAFAVIDAIEAQRIDPADVPPAYWRTVHNRLVVHQETPLYDGRTYIAHLTRRTSQS